MLEIITVFSAPLYGARSHKHKKMLEALADETPEAAAAAKKAARQLAAIG